MRGKGGTITSVGDLTRDELAQLLREAKDAHVEYERTTGETDEDWPAWYAEYLLERLRERG